MGVLFIRVLCFLELFYFGLRFFGILFDIFLFWFEIRLLIWFEERRGSWVVIEGSEV